MTESPSAQGDSGSQSGSEDAPGSGLDSTCGASSTRSRPRAWNLRVVDRCGAQKKAQRTRAIKAAEALLPGAEPKIDFECGKVCCKVASGKQILVAEITHGYEKFVWRIGDIRTALGVDLTQEHIDKTLERSTSSSGLREKCVVSHSGITFVTWNTCGSGDIDIALLLERMSPVSCWSFVAIQEYGRAQRGGAALGGHRLLYQPCAGCRGAPAIILHGDEVKGFVGVEHSKYDVVAELRQFVALSLHLHNSEAAIQNI